MAAVASPTATTNSNRASPRPPCHCDCQLHSLPAEDRSISPWTFLTLTPQRASRPQSAQSARSTSTFVLPECQCDESCPLLASSPLLPPKRGSFKEGLTATAHVQSPLRVFEGKTIVLLRTSSTARAPVYASLRAKGLRIIMVHPFANREAFPAECIDEWIEMDTNDVDAIENVLRSPEYAGRFDAVASFDEYGVFPAAQLSRRFGQRCMPLSPEMLSTVNIKSRFRSWCLKHNLSAPRFAPIHQRSQDAIATARQAGLLYPIVVKPAPGAGSNLVQLVDCEAQLPACVERLWTAIDGMNVTHFEALGERVHVLMEEFVEGPEVDVDAIVEDGVVKFAGVSDNFETVRPYFSEVGGLAPSALPSNQQDSLVQLLEAFVAATNADGESVTGVLHFEAKYDSRRNVPVSIEVNCRMGSAETHTMVSNGFGVDLGEAKMRLALGLPLQALPHAHVTGRAAAGSGVVCASANLYPTRAGRLVEIRTPVPQPTLLRAMPFPMARGDAVKLPPDSFGCLLWLAACGPDASTAIANMKALCNQCAIEVEEN